MLRYTSTAIRMVLVTVVLLGLVYPLVMTGVIQLVFRRQANGSLVVERGRVVGSELIGQQFARPEYFHPRPSAAGNGYDATASGGSNLGPTSKKLADNVSANVRTALSENPTLRKGEIPADMVTASASGLDPEITPANAAAQLPRIAKARGMSAAKVGEIVRACTCGRQLGVLGEPRVNVLEVNRALDGVKGTQ